ncbi:MAG: hypothetical protein H6619_03815 [Deltaproteobacteria bacterium]|nr:hypothetical protein [Deltaproteobacteria bacterium]
MKIIKFYLLTFVLLFAVSVHAQVEQEQTQSKNESLASILQSIETSKADLAKKQKLLQSNQSLGRKEDVTREIEALSNKIEDLNQSFTEIASGIDLAVFSPELTETNFSWSQDLKDLLQPLVDELKQLTSQPREINALRKEVASYALQREKARQAIENINQFSAEQAQDISLKKALKSSTEDWKAKLGEIETRLSIAQQKLDKRLSERRSISQSIEHIFQVFFKSRGRNLFLAFLFAFIYWYLIKKLREVIDRTAARSDSRSTLTARILHLSYVVAAIVGSIAVFIVALYFFEDWVLLILAILLLVGIAWATKEALPKFWAQGALLLNVGPTREGERVIYNGIPWRVKDVNFYSLLENTALVGGVVRLPIQDLFELRSRPMDPNEPWFPTHVNDWVVMPDGTYGQVIFQNPEVVQLRKLGGSIVSYPSSDFVSLNPQLLSKGFRTSVTFGFDYQDQANITSVIPEKLHTALSAALAEQGFEDKIVNMKVEFQEAGASSLNLAIIIDFKGEAAYAYNMLPRLIQTICVDACNSEGWNIPFDQLTLHVANKN